MTDRDDDREGSEVRKQIGQQIKQDGVVSHFCPRGEADEDISDLRDTGIGQESLHVLLRNRHDVAVGHR